MNKGGTIKKLPNGKYMWVGYYKDENGKIHRPNRTFKTLKEAEAYRKQQEEKALTINKLKSGRDYTFKEYFDLWTTLTWQDESYYSFTTINSWKYVFNKHIFPYIANQKLDNINYDEMNAYFSKSELSRKSLGNIRQILARLQHRPRRPGIAGTARPSFSVVWRAPGWLGAEPAPDFFRAGDAPRAHDAAIDDYRRGGQHAQGHDLPQVGDFFHRGVTAGSGHRLADDLVRFDTFGATGTKDFDDHDAVSFGKILRGSGRAGCVGLPSAVMREGRVRPMPSPA